VTKPCLYCDDTGHWPPPGVGMGDVIPEPCPMGCNEDEDEETPMTEPLARVKTTGRGWGDEEASWLPPDIYVRVPSGTEVAVVRVDSLPTRDQIREALGDAWFDSTRIHDKLDTVLNVLADAVVALFGQTEGANGE
jgi:hypothetical protein